MMNLGSRNQIRSARSPLNPEEAPQLQQLCSEMLPKGGNDSHSFLTAAFSGRPRKLAVMVAGAGLSIAALRTFHCGNNSMLADPILAGSSNSVLIEKCEQLQISATLESLLADGTVDRWINTDSPIRADDLRGKVVIVDFWATWCAPCIHSLKVLQQEIAQFDNRQIVILALTPQSYEVTEPFLRARSFCDQDARIFFGTGASRAHGLAKVKALPTTFIYDKHGGLLYPDNEEIGEAKLPDLVKIVSVARKAVNQDSPSQSTSLPRLIAGATSGSETEVPIGKSSSLASTHRQLFEETKKLFTSPELRSISARNAALKRLFKVYHENLPSDGHSGDAKARRNASLWLASALVDFKLSEEERKFVREELFSRLARQDPDREVRLDQIDVLYATSLNLDRLSRIITAQNLLESRSKESDPFVAWSLEWAAEAVLQGQSIQWIHPTSESAEMLAKLESGAIPDLKLKEDYRRFSRNWPLASVWGQTSRELDSAFGECTRVKFSADYNSAICLSLLLSAPQARAFEIQLSADVIKRGQEMAAEIVLASFDPNFESSFEVNNDRAIQFAALQALAELGTNHLSSKTILQLRTVLRDWREEKIPVIKWMERRVQLLIEQQ